MSSTQTAPAQPETFSKRVQEAQGLARAGKTPEVELAWRALLAERPDSLTAVTGLVEALEAAGDRPAAAAALRGFITVAPTHGNVLAAARLWERWQEDPAPGARAVRVALAGHGTLDSLGAHLRVACAQAGLHPALFVSGFDQWAQDLLPPESALYGFGPELIILRLDAAALFPRTVADFPAPDDVLEAERAAGLARVEAVLSAVRRHAPGATVLVHTFPQPDHSPTGVFDLTAPDGQRRRIDALNGALVALARAHAPAVLLLDQERVEARHGKSRVRDERLWYLASIPFSESFLPVLAAEYLRVIRPLTGLVRKCVVLDLDNTLWGGVVGEDGVNGLRLGGTAAPGNAFYDFQCALDALRRRGVLLALCSKNNEEDVWPALAAHPHMVLRRDAFAAARVNWRDKAENLREIARELNIGLDSLVFLDDNPAERAQVRQRLPEVLTVEMPRDPALYRQTLLGLDVFETLGLTEEDRRRGQLYQEQVERRRYEESVTDDGDLAGYLAGLEMTVRLAPATPFTLPRIVQLINKTNQFNLTTRRYTEAQVEAMAGSPESWAVYSASVSDRFGDSGLTGVTLARKGGAVWEIDSFLLSCRVLGRGVEDALLCHLMDEARAAGAGLLRGRFIPTAKNAPAAEFYPRQGFREASEPGAAAGEAGTVWEMDLGDPAARKKMPEWLEVMVER